MDDSDFAYAAAYLVVEVPDTGQQTVRVNITLPEITLKRIDAEAKKRGMTRSSFLVHAAQSTLKSNQSESSAYK
jgi:metal-responsive CopG/Arc/MetJ family transcriptional regulator